MRMHSYVILLACLLAAACNPTDTPAARQSDVNLAAPSARDTFDATLREHGLRIYWDRQAQLRPGETIARQYLLDENVYYLTNLNTLLCYNARTGVFKWACNVAPANTPVFAPAHVDEVTFPDDTLGMPEILAPETIQYAQSFDAVTINTLSYVMLINRETGHVVRSPDEGRFDDFAADGPGVCDGINYFVGSPTGRCYALDLLAGDGVEAWREDAYGSIGAAVRYYNDRVYFASYDGLLRCFKTVPEIEFIWAKITQGRLVTDFLIHRGRLLLPCETNRLYCLDALNGEELWPPFITRGDLTTPVQASEDTIFQYADDDGLYAVDLHTGEQRWRLADGRYVAAVVEGVAYVIDANQQMRLIDELSGEQIGMIDMSDFTMIMPNADGSAIYAVTDDQILYCLRPLSAGYLTPDMLTD
jgi:outer membrane protein assembly factor BamB